MLLGVTREDSSETSKSPFVWYVRLVPYEIDLVHPALDLVNSQHGQAPDLLDDAAWFDRFLARWGYAAAGPPIPRDRARLVDLRALLRRVVEAVDRGETPPPADLAELDAVLKATRLQRALEPGTAGPELRLVPVRPDWKWVLSEIASSFVELASDGETRRIKVCDNPACRFAFYDETKNRSRRWCAQATCGNRHKVREFRARQRRRLGR